MTKKDKYLIFTAVTIAGFLATYTGSAINIALHVIGEELGIDYAGLQYVATAYFIMNGVLLVPFGKLADIFGRRFFLLIGMVLFMAAHMAAAFATAGWMLIVCRGLAGIAASMFFSNTVAILSSVFLQEERGRILGLNMAFAYIGITAGPFLGGILTSLWGWRSVFWSVVPIAMLGFILAWWKIPKNMRSNNSILFNSNSLILYVSGLILFTLGLSALPATKGYLMVGCASILAVFFAFSERHSSAPLIGFALFSGNRVFLWSNVANFIQYYSTFATSFLLALFLQNPGIKGLSPHEAGLIMLIQPLIQAIFSPLAGALSDRFPSRTVAFCGISMTAAALVCFILISPATPIWKIGFITGLLGTGFAFFTAPNNNSIMSSVQSDHYGIASGLLATGRIIGMSLSLATTSMIFNLLGLGESADGFLRSFRMDYLVFTIICFVGILALFLQGNKETVFDR
jgi:MFS family permease